MIRGELNAVICPNVPLVMLLVGLFQFRVIHDVEEIRANLKLQRSLIWNSRLRPCPN